MSLKVDAFFDSSTFTYTYVITNVESGSAAVIDPVLDYEPAAGRTCTCSAEAVLEHLVFHGLDLVWILETHIHADHLSAAAYLKSKFPSAKIGIGEHVAEVQSIFGERFNAESCFVADGSQFDALFSDGVQVAFGDHTFHVLSTPGHTPACVTYVFDGFAFVGDTLLMPDYGTARADFPGGDARTLYRSIQRILALPDDTTLYMCHDYGTAERCEFRYETTVAAQREGNVLVHGGVEETQFVAQRESRDAKLTTPQLLYPAVQFNMRGGRLPPAEPNGQRYFKIPVRSA